MSSDLDPIHRSIWLNGDFVPWQDATLHVLSHAVQRGSLVFDYLSVHQTPRGAAIFRMPEHIDRFFHSCDLIGLVCPILKPDLQDAVIETAARNPGARAIKMSAFLPSIEVDVVPVDDRVSIAIAAYDPQQDVNARKPTPPAPRPKTLRLWIEKEVRNRRDDILSPHAKVAANYVATMTAKAKARANGYDEILLIDEFDQIAEAPTANIFMVDGEGRLCTPPESRVLLGVTRTSILELARADGITVCEEPILPEQLLAAEEVFITGTSAGVWPVDSIDGAPIGSGEVGPMAKRLAEIFSRVIAGEDPRFDHWLTYVDRDSSEDAPSMEKS
jgi:branched-chain amino acid aminotransferase